MSTEKRTDDDVLKAGDKVIVLLNINFEKQTLESEPDFLYEDQMADREKSVRIFKDFKKVPLKMQDGEAWIARIESVSKARNLTRDGRVKMYFDITFLERKEEAAGFYFENGKLFKRFLCGNRKRLEEVPVFKKEAKYRDKNWRGKEVIVTCEEFFDSQGTLLHRRPLSSSDPLTVLEDMKVGGKRIDPSRFLQGYPEIHTAQVPFLAA